MTAPVSTDRRQQRRDAMTARILTEAWALARRDGLAAISLRDLADAVGLRQPSLYVYFASKRDLYDAMFADGYRQLLAIVDSQHYPDDSRRSLGNFVAECVQFSSADVVRHQLLFQRTIPGFEPSEQSYALALEFYEVGRRLARAAGIRTQHDFDLFTALVSGLAHQQIANDPGGRRWVRQADRAVDLLISSVESRRTPQAPQPRQRSTRRNQR
jgi:AcrR family transcriptional regulator